MDSLHLLEIQMQILVINPNNYFGSNYSNISQPCFSQPNFPQSNISQLNSQPNFSQQNLPQSNFMQYSHQNLAQPPVQHMSNINPNLHQSNQDLNTNNMITAGNQNEIRRQFIRRLKSIPKFDGNSYRELIDFIDIADTLFNSCMNEDQS